MMQSQPSDPIYRSLVPLEAYREFIIEEESTEKGIQKGIEYLVANERLTDQTVLPFVLDEKIYYDKGGERIVGGGYLIETRAQRVIARLQKFDQSIQELFVIFHMQQEKIPGIWSYDPQCYYPNYNNNKVREAYILQEPALCDLEKFMAYRRERKLKFTSKETLGILQNLAETIYFLHRNSIAYCDLDASNILISIKDRQARLADFGGAQFILKEYKKPIIVSTKDKGKKFLNQKIIKKGGEDLIELDIYLFQALAYFLKDFTEPDEIFEQAMGQIINIETDEQLQSLYLKFQEYRDEKLSFEVKDFPKAKQVPDYKSDFNLGLDQFNLSMFPQAQKTFETINNKEPGKIQVQILLGKIYLEQQEMQKAYKCYRNAIQIYKSQPDQDLQTDIKSICYNLLLVSFTLDELMQAEKIVRDIRFWSSTHKLVKMIKLAFLKYTSLNDLKTEINLIYNTLTQKEDVLRHTELKKAYTINQFIDCENQDQPVEIVEYFMYLIDILTLLDEKKKINYLCKLLYLDHQDAKNFRNNQKDHFIQNIQFIYTGDGDSFFQLNEFMNESLSKIYSQGGYHSLDYYDIQNFWVQLQLYKVWDQSKVSKHHITLQQLLVRIEEQLQKKYGNLVRFKVLKFNTLKSLLHTSVQLQNIPDLRKFKDKMVDHLKEMPIISQSKWGQVNLEIYEAIIQQDMPTVENYLINNLQLFQAGINDRYLFLLYELLFNQGYVLPLEVVTELIQKVEKRDDNISNQQIQLLLQWIYVVIKDSVASSQNLCLDALSALFEYVQEKGLPDIVKSIYRLYLIYYCWLEDTEQFLGYYELCVEAFKNDPQEYLGLQVFQLAINMLNQYEVDGTLTSGEGMKLIFGQIRQLMLVKPVIINNNQAAANVNQPMQIQQNAQFNPTQNTPAEITSLNKFQNQQPLVEDDILPLFLWCQKQLKNRKQGEFQMCRSILEEIKNFYQDNDWNYQVTSSLLLYLLTILDISQFQETLSSLLSRFPDEPLYSTLGQLLTAEIEDKQIREHLFSHFETQGWGDLLS